MPLLIYLFEKITSSVIYHISLILEFALGWVKVSMFCTLILIHTRTRTHANKKQRIECGDGERRFNTFKRSGKEKGVFEGMESYAKLPHYKLD